MTMKRVAIIGLVVILLGAGYLAIGFVMYERLGHVKAGCLADDGKSTRYEGVTPSNLAYDPADIKDADPSLDLAALRMSDYSDVSFMSGSDPRHQPVRIAAWWVPSQNGDAPAVVLVHGLDSCRRDWNVMIPAGMLHRAGFSVLAIDLRNHGDLEVVDHRFYGGLIERLDVQGAVDWLDEAHGISPRHVGVFGASLGAATAMLAAADDEQIPAVWEDSGYADPEQRVVEQIDETYHIPMVGTLVAPSGGFVSQMLSGIDIYSDGPLKAVSRLTGRALAIVQGADDSTTYPHHALDLYKAARADGVDTELWIVPGAEHTREMLVDPAEYEEHLDGFFRTYLQSGT